MDVKQVVVNGFPKTGTHAGKKACELLGWPVVLEHRPSKDGWKPGETHHIHMIRDPRNVAVSWLRFNHQPVTAGTLMKTLRQFQGRPLRAEMSDYFGWLLDDRVLTVRFEDLIADDAALRRIAVYLDTPYIDGAFEELPGLTITWTGKYSDYREVWTPDVELVWQEQGGPALLGALGY